MGETPRRRSPQALRDLHDAGCDLITITQYLRPTPAPPPGRALGQARGVRRARREAEEIGFAGVMAGPLVRSSYRAGRLYAQAVAHRGEELPPALAHLAAGARPARRHGRCWRGSGRGRLRGRPGLGRGFFRWRAGSLGLRHLQAAPTRQRGAAPDSRRDRRTRREPGTPRPLRANPSGLRHPQAALNRGFVILG